MPATRTCGTQELQRQRLEGGLGPSPLSHSLSLLTDSDDSDNGQKRVRRTDNVSTN
ncbi:MAG: hypothetical protein ACXV4B_08015 [Halobacteriota archaeon]